MATRSNEQPEDKRPKLLEDTELSPEIRPEDVRKHMLGAFDVLLNIAQTHTDPHQVFSAIKGLDTLYTTVLMATRLDEFVTKHDHNEKDLLREVKKRRKPGWMEEDEEEN